MLSGASGRSPALAFGQASLRSVIFFIITGDFQEIKVNVRNVDISSDLGDFNWRFLKINLEKRKWEDDRILASIFFNFMIFINFRCDLACFDVILLYFGVFWGVWR